MLAYIQHRNRMDNRNYKPRMWVPSFRKHGPKTWLRPKPTSRKDLLLYERLSYNLSLLDTCPLAVIDPLSPELKMLHTPGYNPKDNCTIYKPMTELENGEVKVLSEKSICMARCILPETTDRTYDTGPYIRVPTEELFECDIIETKCYEEGPVEYYMHLKIHETPVKKEDVKPLPSVYILLLDSVSTFMVKRSLPRTLDFLKTRMDAVQMEFLNKVADNSRPNGFPMAFGKSLEKVSRVGRDPEPPDWDNDEVCNKYMDEYPYYLEEFKKKGYKTMIAQDLAPGIIFYQECYGFKRRQADHIYRPFDVRLDEESLNETLAGFTCGESHLYMLEYYEKFMNAYSGIPKIAQAWVTRLVHDDIRKLYHADDHFLEFFQRNQENLDNAFLFFLGDHGPRAAGIEKSRLSRYENRNPFLVVSLPKMLRKTAVQKELQKKSMQLMTHFDLHATFMDILHFQSKSNFMETTEMSMEPYSKGSSLLREWYGLRTCNNLPIPWDYCLCQYKKEDVIDENLKRRLGTFLAEQLNEFITATGFSSKCYSQQYEEALDVQRLEVGNSNIYSVFVKLAPSEGYFSAEILETPSGLQLVSHFTRWGWYGTQGDCVLDPPRSLCHCNDR
ncbi:hypothetical protein RB195_004936 [Necator americanus]